MEYRNLPGTDLEFSGVGFDGFTVGSDWQNAMEEMKRVRLLEEAFHLGINFFDTADIYGEGYGEELLSKAFKKNRHDVIIGTKFGYDLHDIGSLLNFDRLVHRFDKQFVRSACERSLRRLKTDYIDLYQIHDPPNDVVDTAELFVLLDDLVGEGKIRHYGAAITRDIDFDMGVLGLLNRTNVAALQVPFNILDYEQDNKILSLAKEKETGLIARLSNAMMKSSHKDRYGATDCDVRYVDADLKMMEIESKKRVSIDQKLLYDQFEITSTQFEINVHLNQISILSVLGNIASTAELLEHIAAVDTKKITSEEIGMLERLFVGEFRRD